MSEEFVSDVLYPIIQIVCKTLIVMSVCATIIGIIVFGGVPAFFISCGVSFMFYVTKRFIDGK